MKEKRLELIEMLAELRHMPPYDESYVEYGEQYNEDVRWANSWVSKNSSFKIEEDPYIYYL